MNRDQSPDQAEKKLKRRVCFNKPILYEVHVYCCIGIYMSENGQATDQPKKKAHWLRFAAVHPLRREK